MSGDLDELNKILATIDSMDPAWEIEVEPSSRFNSTRRDYYKNHSIYFTREDNIRTELHIWQSAARGDSSKWQTRIGLEIVQLDDEGNRGIVIFERDYEHGAESECRERLEKYIRSAEPVIVGAIKQRRLNGQSEAKKRYFG